MTTSIVQNADGSYTKTVDGKPYTVGVNDPKYGKIGGDYAAQQGYGQGAGGIDVSGNIYYNGGSDGESGGSGGGDDSYASDGKKKERSSGSLIGGVYRHALTARERQLKRALEEALDSLEEQAAETEKEYAKARAASYAGQLVANKNSNEAMLNQGINSGAIAQAALSSNNALQGNLGTLSADLAQDLAEIGADKTQVRQAYQDDLAALQASLESEKLNALLEDYYRRQG